MRCITSSLIRPTSMRAGWAAGAAAGGGAAGVAGAASLPVARETTSRGGAFGLPCEGGDRERGAPS
jgi:hypothetical protein